MSDKPTLEEEVAALRVAFGIERAQNADFRSKVENEIASLRKKLTADAVETEEETSHWVNIGTLAKRK
jgi:hypothetical protein